MEKLSNKEISVDQEKCLDDSLTEKERITQYIIDKLPRPDFVTVKDKEVSECIFQYCRQLLKYSMERHDSKEMAYAINLETLAFIGVAFGNTRTIDVEELVIKMEDSDSVFVILHNHPGNCTFSPRDLNTFIEVANLSVLVVIGNGGAVFVIEKTKAISGDNFHNVKKEVIGYRNGKVSFEDTIKKLSVFGIVYSCY